VVERRRALGGETVGVHGAGNVAEGMSKYFRGRHPAGAICLLTQMRLGALPLATTRSILKRFEAETLEIWRIASSERLGVHRA
jgi:hypothetical protein